MEVRVHQPIHTRAVPKLANLSSTYIRASSQLPTQIPSSRSIIPRLLGNFTPRQHTGRHLNESSNLHRQLDSKTHPTKQTKLPATCTECLKKNNPSKQTKYLPPVAPQINATSSRRNTVTFIFKISPYIRKNNSNRRAIRVQIFRCIMQIKISYLTPRRAGDALKMQMELRLCNG